jgi:HK97 family phage major capsid protein
MSQWKKLADRKAELVREANEICERAGANGELTTDDSERFKAIEFDLVSISEALDRENRRMDMERQLALTSLHGSTALTPLEPPPQVPAKFDSMGEFMVAVASAGMNQGMRYDPRLTMVAGGLGQNEAVPSEGGFLVQKDFSDEFLRLMHDQGQIYSRVRQIPISGNSDGIRFLMTDETSRVNGSRWGGVNVYWANEGATVPPSTIKFRVAEMSLKKIMGISYATNEILRDAPALESLLDQAFMEEMLFRIEDSILNGTGSGQPLGILNSGAIVTVAAETSPAQGSGTIVTANILKMAARQPVSSAANSVWLVNVDTMTQLWGLTMNNGMVSLYRPPGVDGPTFASAYGYLLGRPVIPVEMASSLGTIGDIMLVDLSQYLFIQKDGRRGESSMHVRFIYDEMTFRWVWRVDGQPAWNKPLTPAKGSNTLSPFVLLASRP